jgi:predicted GNAT family acetyltransferase
MVNIEREDNGKKGRFVIYENDVPAGEMSYVWTGKTRSIIDHTGVEPSFSGRGFGEQLVAKAVEYARDNNLKILPLCPFAKKVFDNDVKLDDVRA